MTKAKLFNYRDSQLYFKTYGINPEKHFDKLCEKYGTDTAIEMTDRNMMNAWKRKWKADREKEEREKRILDSECPFC